MPNWVKNRIYTNDMDTLKRVAVTLNEQAEPRFTFSTLKPRPKELSFAQEFRHLFYDKGTVEKFYTLLNGICRKPLQLAKDFEEFTQMYEVAIAKNVGKYQELLIIAQANNFTSEKLFEERAKGTLIKIEDHKQAIFEVATSLFNLKHHNAVNWYEWSYDNWGTKWDASECVISDNFIEFDTAWSTPKEFFDELAKHLDFMVTFSDEDMGSNLGVLQAKNGILETVDLFEDETFETKYCIACILHGFNVDEDVAYFNENLEDEEEQITEDHINTAIELVTNATSEYNAIEDLLFRSSDYEVEEV